MEPGLILNTKSIGVSGKSQVGNGQILVKGNLIEDVTRQLTYVEMLFFQLQDRLPTLKEKIMLSHYLVSLCEHADTSPSTHGARVASNVGASFSSSAISFIAGASGLYHFGALEKAMQEIRFITDNMLDVGAYVTDKLSSGERIWGFGHRFHRTENSPNIDCLEYDALGEKKDPRVRVLFEIADEIGWEGNHLRIVRDIGKILYQEKGLPINIDGVGAGLSTEQR